MYTSLKTPLFSSLHLRFYALLLVRLDAKVPSGIRSLNLTIGIRKMNGGLLVGRSVGRSTAGGMNDDDGLQTIFFELGCDGRVIVDID